MLFFADNELEAIAKALENTTWNENNFILNVKDGIILKPEENIESRYNVEADTIINKLSSLTQEDLKILQNLLKTEYLNV